MQHTFFFFCITIIPSKRIFYIMRRRPKNLWENVTLRTNIHRKNDYGKKS